jgi:hypothetical protein
MEEVQKASDSDKGNILEDYDIYKLIKVNFEITICISLCLYNVRNDMILELLLGLI